jgi:hypothetical protein
VRLMITSDEIYVCMRIYEYSLLDTKCGNKNMSRMVSVLSNIKVDDESNI